MIVVTEMLVTDGRTTLMSILSTKKSRKFRTKGRSVTGVAVLGATLSVTVTLKRVRVRATRKTTFVAVRVVTIAPEETGKSCRMMNTLPLCYSVRRAVFVKTFMKVVLKVTMPVSTGLARLTFLTSLFTANMSVMSRFVGKRNAKTRAV